MANLITITRMSGSVLLLFISPLSPAFFVLYGMIGMSDAVDGWVARKTNTVSELGSKLDTIADFILVVVGFIKWIPIIEVAMWIWIWIGLIAAIKIINLLFGIILYKKIVVEHTLMNKVSGFLLFLLPLTFTIIEIKFSAIVVCGVASLEAIQEGHLIRTGRMIE